MQDKLQVQIRTRIRRQLKTRIQIQHQMVTRQLQRRQTQTLIHLLQVIKLI
jgi:hypothetical protein